MRECTAVERLIMAAIWEENGESNCLSDLALRVGTDRSYAIQCTNRLEKRGCLVVIKEPAPKPSRLVAVANPINLKCNYACRLLQGPMEYPQPKLSEEEQANAAIVARKINAMNQVHKRLTLIFALCVENMCLLKEINDHRAVRGYELHPIIDPKDMKVG